MLVWWEAPYMHGCHLQACALNCWILGQTCADAAAAAVGPLPCLATCAAAFITAATAFSLRDVRAALGQGPLHVCCSLM
jgi:hypothetical protein